MSFSRTILRPIAYLISLHAQRQVDAFLASHQRTQEVQDRLLRELIARHAQTQFGRDHGFASIQTYEDFKAAVPVGNYDRFRPYVDKVLHGQFDALLPAGEPPLMFSMTSGTTGSPKYIPVTARCAGELRRGWNIFGLMMLNDHRAAWLRHVLQISSRMRECDGPTGLPCGAVSGLLAATQKKIVRHMYVVPVGVYSIPDATARYYTILRCGVGRDVAFITTANPSSTIKLIETGQQHCERLIKDVADGTTTPPGDHSEAQPLRFRPDKALARRLEEGVRRDGRLLPRHFWNLTHLANWTGGTLKLYLRRLGDLFDGVPVRDIGLLASEGRFSVPLQDGTPAGVAEITCNFLEFIPAAEAGRDNPTTLRAHEVEVGGEYSLVFSNSTGLWRYNMDDRIRVVDRLGQSPIFEFLHRGSSTANITGEKLSEHQAVEAMRKACAATGVAVDRFVLQGHFAAVPYYQLDVDSMDAARAAVLAAAMDAALGELNIEYQSKRDSGRLGTIRPSILPAGELEQAERRKIAARRGRTEQYKHQYLLTEIVED